MNPSVKQIKIISIIAAFFVLAFIYIGHFHNGFFYDDIYCIQQNPALQSLKNIPAFFSDAHSFASIQAYQTYRPFYLLSFAIDYYIGNGPNPVVMHIHTFIGFIALCILLFFFAKKVFSHLVSDPFYPSLLAVCLFAFHPTTADVINYHYARSDSFAALYGMMAIVVYLYSSRARKYYLYLIPLFIGCMFKINAGMYVVMLWLYIMFFENDSGLNSLISMIRKTFKEMMPALLVVFGSASLMLLVGKFSDTMGVSRTTSIMTEVHVIMNYFMLFFLPENINPNGWRNFITSPFDYQFVTGMMFFILMGVVIYFTSLYKTTRIISFGLLWFFVFLFPACFLLTLIVPQVDYYVFNSMIGMSIAAAAVVAIACNKLTQQTAIAKWLIAGVCVITLSAFAYGSRQRVKVWGSEMAMYEDVLKKDPTNGRELMNYGTVLLTEGKVQDAEQYFEKAKQFAPTYDLVYVNLAIINVMNNDTATAEANFKQAVSLNGWDHYTACYFYGRYLSQRHRNAEAIPQLREAVKEYPSYTDAWHLLMDIYAATHDKELGATCRQTLNMFPGDANAANYYKLYLADSTQYIEGGTTANNMEKFYLSHPSAANYINLSLSYFGKGEYMKVVDACKKVVELDPKSAIAYNNMCAAYNNLKMWDDAIEAGKMALKIEPGMTLAQNNLNFALQQKKAGK